MRSILISTFLILSNFTFSQITYVDFFDAVCPLTGTGSTTHFFDINGDGEDDIKLYFNKNVSFSTTCGSTTGTGWYLTSFFGVSNSIGQNLLNSPTSTSIVGIDCTDDTLNIFDSWSLQNNLYRGWYNTQNLCFNMGTGSHKQGF